MSRYLLVGDVHLADKPPSVRKETYADEILAKLSFCAEYANLQHLDAIIYLGDVFHVKSPTRNSHRLIQATAEVMQQFTGHSYIVPGNHDLSQDRLDSLDSQPLGTLALAPRIHLIDGYVPDLDVTAFPYTDDLDEFITGVQAATDPDLVTPPSLVVTHQSIFPPGENPPYAHVTADRILPGAGVPLAYGHIHDPHGFYEVNGSWFCNNGAISRGSLHEETVKRHPRITVFDSTADGCPFVSVEVPHKPAEEVFRLAGVEEKKAQEERLDAFLERVGEVSLTSLSLESVLRDAEQKLQPSTMAELRDIFEEIQ